MAYNHHQQHQHVLTNQGSISDLTLYTSPSLPNISLGRPAMASSSSVTSHLRLDCQTIRTGPRYSPST